MTPVGAEKAGNKDNTIPAWDGGLTKAPAGFDVKKGYADPFAGEKPLFTITAANAEQYKDKLSVGQLAMLKKYPTFKMIVYPTHRTAAYPANVTDDVKKFAGERRSCGQWERRGRLGLVHGAVPVSEEGRRGALEPQSALARRRSSIVTSAGMSFSPAATATESACTRNGSGRVSDTSTPSATTPRA